MGKTNTYSHQKNCLIAMIVKILAMKYIFVENNFTLLLQEIKFIAIFI